MKAYSESGLFDGRYNNKVFADRIARLPLARQPGTLWRYGHSTDVLGRIIEIVSGQTLYQFEKQHIFDPLGMTSTKFVLESADERARMAEPLPGDTILKKAEAERRAHPEWESGGGGLVSSLTDYARFAQMILNGGELDGKRYLSPAAFKSMTIRSCRAGFRRCAGLLLLSRRRLRLRLWLCGTHRSGKCQTAAARFNRRTQMGQRQRHLLRCRPEAGHDLHPAGANPERTWAHHTRLQEAGLRRIRHGQMICGPAATSNPRREYSTRCRTPCSERHRCHGAAVRRSGKETAPCAGSTARGRD